MNPSTPPTPLQPSVPPVPQMPATPTPPAPQAPADMFAGLDAGLGSPIPPMGINPGQPAAAAQGMAPEPAGSSRKYFIVGFLVLLLIGIVVGGYFAYAKFSAMVNKDKEPSAAVETPVETAKTEIVATTSTKPAVETSETLSATSSSAVATSTGLLPATSSPLAAETATTSASAATSTATAVSDRTKDSDNDGLTDYEETNFYHTNPNIADTDGDGFADGAEVKNGFNPLGAGKMIDSQIKPQ